jgi:hypothetical protein
MTASRLTSSFPLRSSLPRQVEGELALLVGLACAFVIVIGVFHIC